MKLNEYSKKCIHYYTGEIPILLKDIFNQYHHIKSVVDLGSGDGSILLALRQQGFLDNLEKVVAVDISSKRLDNVRKISEKILCVTADVCNLTALKETDINLAISNQVIEHLSDENKFFQEVYRILSRDGILYLSTVFKKWYGWYFYRCNGRWVLDPTHLQEYTNTARLLDMVKRHKFEIIKDKKTLHWFPISDFIFKRIGFGRAVYNNKLARFLRIVKIPILGYYNWELVLKKSTN